MIKNKYMLGDTVWYLVKDNYTVWCGRIERIGTNGNEASYGIAGHSGSIPEECVIGTINDSVEKLVRNLKRYVNTRARVTIEYFGEKLRAERRVR